LVVKRQEVVAGRFESGTLGNAFDALAVPVVVMAPSIELVSALLGGLVDEAVSPLGQCRLDEAFGLAIGLGSVRSSKAVFNFQRGAGLGEVFGAKGPAVVGQQWRSPVTRWLGRSMRPTCLMSIFSRSPAAACS